MTTSFDLAVMKGGSTMPISRYGVELRYAVAALFVCIPAEAGFRSIFHQQPHAAPETPPD